MSTELEKYIEENYISRALVGEIMNIIMNLKLHPEIELLLLRASLRKGDILTIDEIDELVKEYLK